MVGIPAHLFHFGRVFLLMSFVSIDRVAIFSSASSSSSSSSLKERFQSTDSIHSDRLNPLTNQVAGGTERRYSFSGRMMQQFWVSVDSLIRLEGCCDLLTPWRTYFSLVLPLFSLLLPPPPPSSSSFFLRVTSAPFFIYQ